MIFHHIYLQLPQGHRDRNEEQKTGLRSLCEKILNKDSIVIEIGSAGGASTEIFANYCQRIYAIDPWVKCCPFDGATGYLQQFNKKIFPMYLHEKKFDLRAKTMKNIVKIKSRSEDCVNLFEDKSIDLVYIDSIHTYDEVMLAFQQYEPKIKDNQFIAGHDYYGCWPEVIKAVNDTYGSPDLKFSDTSWVVKLTKKRRKYS